MENRNKSKKADFKITFLAGTLGTGGAERQLFYLISNLRKEGYSVSVICLTQNEFWEKSIMDLGVDIHFVGSSSNRLKRLYYVYRAAKRIKPNLLYSFHFYTNAYAGLTGLICSIRTFGSIRSDGTSEKKANGYLSWAHYFLPDVIIANSEHGLKNCKRIFYSKKSGVLPNVIDLEKFQFSQPRNESPFSLVFIGRMEEQKQPFLFLRLMELLVEKDFDCEGVMYGDGSLKSRLISLKESRFSHVPIQIFPSHANIEEIYQTADCLVILSKYEGTPNVVLEAMASGLIVAALSFDGIENIIESRLDGLIADDIDSLVQEISFCFRHKSYLSLSRLARMKIERDFALKSQINKFESLLLKFSSNDSL